MLVLMIFLWAAGACLFVFGFAWGIARRRFNIGPVGLIVAGAAIVIASVWVGHTNKLPVPSILREISQAPAAACGMPSVACDVAALPIIPELQLHAEVLAA